MKKVIINGFLLTGKEIYGVQRYAAELLYELDRIVKPGEIEVVVPQNGEREFRFQNIEVTRLKQANPEHKWSWNLFQFSRYVKKHHGISMDLTLTLPLLNCDIVAIHDCIYERCKQNANTFKKKLGRVYHIAVTLLNTCRAKAVITVSHYSKEDISRFYCVPRRKIVVIGSAWQHFLRIESDDSVLEKLSLMGKPYCFALGSRLYHKNFRWIAEAAGQNPQYTFVVSGSSNLGTSDTALDRNTKNLIYAGYLSDGEVKSLMTHCKAFIQPSLYEGFGIPPMEAMCCGAKCIVSNRTSLPEIYGDSVWYIDPLKYNGIDMDQIMRAEIADNSEVLKRFSWKKSAMRLYRLIQKVRNQ